MSVYTCASCGGRFAEANAEALLNWGVPNASEDPSMEIICDGCYQEMTAVMSPKDWLRLELLRDFYFAPNAGRIVP